MKQKQLRENFNNRINNQLKKFPQIDNLGITISNINTSHKNSA